MGGQAFATPGPCGEPPLKTPRMSPQIYTQLKQICQKTLTAHYAAVVSPVDAPGKKDYGDIDFLVQQPRSPDANQQVAKELNAERTVTNNLDFTLAIPRPMEVSVVRNGHEIRSLQGNKDSILPLSDIDDGLPITNNHSAIAGDTKLYAQLDVRVYPATLSLPWISYLHSYGDLGQILGYLSYRLGLTSNDKGFHVRIAEQECNNWKASMIFLSCDPVQVMQFLNLDSETYYTTDFRTEQDLFDWVCTSRTAFRFAPGPDSDVVDIVEDEESGRTGSREETADHKRRMQTRPLFARFMTTVYPDLPVLPIDRSAARTQLLQSALSFFGKQDEYDGRINAVLAANEDEKARLLLVAFLMDEVAMKKDKANEVVRGFKHWVCVTDTVTVCECSHDQGVSAVVSTSPQLKFRAQPEMAGCFQTRLGILLDSERNAMAPAMGQWFIQNWAQIKILERELKKAKSREAVDAKGKNQRTLSEGADDQKAAPLGVTDENSMCE